MLTCLDGALAFLLLERTYRQAEFAMTQALDVNVAATIAREQFALGSVGADMPSSSASAFHRLMAINPSLEIYPVDKDGTILAFTAPATEIRRRRISLDPVRRFIAGDFAYPFLGDDPKQMSGQKIFSAALLSADQPELGYLYVILGGTEVDAVSLHLRPGLLLNGLSLLIALAFVLGLSTAFFAAMMLTRRLRRLAMTIETVREVGFRTHQPLPVVKAPKGDEIDQLTRAYNAMASQISAQTEEIAQATIARQELVANVSHDLRTPLASLRLYLETLLIKEASLSREDRLAYLEIAFTQSNRMDRLIGELFDLVRLDDMRDTIQPEAFQLSELVQDVIQKFTLKAQTKGLSLRGALLPDAPPVHGDLALVERLLDNLLDNAIRHTDRGGEVSVGVSLEQGCVCVEVADTGHGIAANDLPNIFKRFYRGRPAHGPASIGGGGLGLAIAWRIAELHQGRITVSSVVGAGTRFRVFLPAETAPC